MLEFSYKSFLKGVFVMEKKFHSELFSSILYVIIGVLLIIFQSKTLEWAMTAVGVFFVVSGILDLVKQNWAGGAVSLIIGIAILVLGWLATAIVLLVLGILIAVKGVVALIEIIKNKPNNALEIVFPILTIVTGLVLAFGNGLNILIIITGILLAIDGAIGIVGSLTGKKGE